MSDSRSDGPFAALPRKRVAAGGLFLDADQRILIVKPTYRTGWLVPGGVVEAEESPRHGCVREVREEIGLDIEPVRLLCVEYRGQSGDITECLQFVFFCGVLTDEQIASIRLEAAELSAHRFVPLAEALQLLNPRLARRIELSRRALDEGTILYVEDGVA